MITVTVDTEELRKIIREEVQQALKESSIVRELPILLTKSEVMELFSIKNSKMSELLGREDFPKLRDAGRVLVPSKQLLQWIDTHTVWVEKNSNYFDL